MPSTTTPDRGLGAEVFERYFPALRAELERGGAPVWDWGEGLCAVRQLRSRASAQGDVEYVVLDLDGVARTTPA
ncbi:hypothetical protein [Streptomyces sp. NPDC001135]